MKALFKISFFCVITAVLFSCGGNPMQMASEKTGWAYNNPDEGYFNVKNFYEGKVPVGMVYVPVNSYVKGQNATILSAQPNNTKKRVAVSGFFMDMYEVTNLNWREYVQWMSQVYKFFPLEVVRVLPDETVWRSELAYNEPYLANYYTHVAFSFYPVVGVTWEQAQVYAKWRTDRINELQLINNGLMVFKPLNQVAAELIGLDVTVDEIPSLDEGPFEFPDSTTKIIFTTKNARDYVAHASEIDEFGQDLSFDTDYDNYVSAKEWNDAMDGLLYDGMCRLPTEAEWEYAAYSLEQQENGMFIETKSYPWNGEQMRSFGDKDVVTSFYANFMRGRGDLIGQSVNNTLTVPVTFFRPNAYGLYNMAGNVNEWVQDVFRASEVSNDEINTFRGNEFEGDSTYAESVLLKYFPDIHAIPEADRDSMRNMLIKDNKITFSGGDFRDFKDGDKLSSLRDSVLSYRDASGIEKANMISNTSRVYKGGSWKDRALWLNPGNRRHMEQSKCTNDIGFRCVMSIVGGKEHMRE